MRKALWAVILGVAVYTALVLRSDVSRVGRAISAIHPVWIPVFLALPLSNYFFRFLKWHYFLRRVGVFIPRGESLAVFVAGFSMAVSPGKFGELVKCVILKERRGVPVSTTSPVVVAERITDLLSMVCLAAAGAALSGGGAVFPAIAAGVFFVSATMVFILFSPAWGLAVRTASRLPLLKTRTEALEAFRKSAITLLDWRSMLVSVPLGILGWGLEALVLCAVAASMGISLPAGVALLSHAAGTIAGAVSMIPGGLGLTELTIDGILGGSMTHAQAAVTTLLMRFCTLWFGVVLGLAVISVLGRGKQKKYTDAATDDLLAPG